MANAIRISNRQYNLIREMMEGSGITLDRMLRVSQVTAGGSVRRGWFKWNPARSLFMLTEEGRNVMQAFASTDIDRKNAKNPLSKFISTRYRVAGASKRAVA